jgi:hypothetical protein
VPEASRTNTFPQVISVPADETRRVGTGAGPRRSRPTGAIVLWIVAAAWTVILLLILRNAVFVSDDAISNYGHVWYVSDRIWRFHHIPWSMPVIGHGKALAFPYALVPWLSAALLRPVLGDWVVTLWLVVGTVGLIAATFWAFPELRRGWWAAAVLVNPALVVAAIIGQLPFLWGASMLMGAVACWRRRRYVFAAVLAGLGQATHPAVVLPMGIVLVASWWYWEPDRRRLLRYYAASLLPAIPAALLVFLSPVFGDSDPVVVATSFFGTLGVRILVLAMPIALVIVQRRLRSKPTSSRATSRFPAAVCLTLLLSNVVLAGPLEAQYSWGALGRKPDTQLLTFIKSSKFSPGAMYRILRAHDGKIGMYQLVQHKARLDSEFFPESIARNNWPDVVKYSRFLRNRRVDYVIIFRSYDREWRTNEHQLLRDMKKQSRGRCDEGRVGVHQVSAATTFDVYRIRRDC